MREDETNEREDDLTFVEIAEQETGGSSDGERSTAGRLVDDGAPESPPDHPIGVDDPAVTVEGQRRGDSLERRLRAEEPARRARPAAGRLVDVDGDQAPDDEPEAIADDEPGVGSGTAEEDAVRIRDDA